MNRFWIVSALMVGVVGSWSGLAIAQQTPPGCTDDSRECMVRAVESYYDAMQSHEGKRAWLAPDVRRTLIGLPNNSGEDLLMQGEATIRESLDRAPAQTHLDHRHWVDEKEKTVVSLMLTTLHDQVATIHVAERFKIDQGLITEIEAVFYLDPTTRNGTTGWPMHPPAPVKE